MRCRAADVREQQGDRDLYPRHLTFAKLGYASRAESRIAWGLPVPRVPKNEATQPGERELRTTCSVEGTGFVETPAAAWLGRDSPRLARRGLVRWIFLGRHLITPSHTRGGREEARGFSKPWARS